MNNLASAYRDAGRFTDALPLYQKVLERRRAMLGPDHPDTLVSMNNLANFYRELGRYLRIDRAPVRGDAATGGDARSRPSRYDALDEQPRAGLPGRRPGRRRGSPVYGSPPAPKDQAGPRSSRDAGLDEQPCRSLPRRGPHGRRLAAFRGDAQASPRHPGARPSPDAPLDERAGPCLPRRPPRPGRADPARGPGNPREEASQRLAHVRGAEPPGREPPRPEEARRRRAVLASRI